MFLSIARVAASFSVSLAWCKHRPGVTVALNVRVDRWLCSLGAAGVSTVMRAVR